MLEPSTRSQNMLKPSLIAALGCLLAEAAFADENHATNQETAIRSAQKTGITASFDILAAHAHRKDNRITFHMTTGGKAGATMPQPRGSLGGAGVFSYVWPTSLDPAAVGFEGKTGILALAATSHPDFDDTPLFDEDGDGNLENDGARWHSHWVVLTPTPACGNNALAVRDIPEGETPKMPATWPGLPIFIDSPGYTPLFDGPEIAVTVPFSAEIDLKNVAYDGVTSALRVNENIHAPLLCVTDIFDIASGDLSLPGKID